MKQKLMLATKHAESSKEDITLPLTRCYVKQVC
jgi:hypothetical protein